jgi:hypothetical protein
VKTSLRRFRDWAAHGFRAVRVRKCDGGLVTVRCDGNRQLLHLSTTSPPYTDFPEMLRGCHSVDTIVSDGRTTARLIALSSNTNYEPTYFLILYPVTVDLPVTAEPTRIAVFYAESTSAGAANRSRQGWLCGRHRIA